MSERRVFKYPLLLSSGDQQVQIPHGGVIVHVHEQNGQPTLWVDVNDSSPLVTREFRVVATGEPVPLLARHVGTVHVDWAVWHVYEVRPLPVVADLDNCG